MKERERKRKERERKEKRTKAEGPITQPVFHPVTEKVFPALLKK